MSKPPNDDYEVGYGKPPKHTRFKSGQSGNPRGRPKGQLSLEAALNRALSETMEVIDKNGRRRKLSKLDVAITGLVNRSVKGDAKATQQLLALSPLVGLAPPTSANAPLDANDAAIMADLIKRMEAGKKKAS
jgi:hypothetical protein